jgi:hypothetical protein
MRLRDDVAELSMPDGPVVATVDALVEGVHFFPYDPIDGGGAEAGAGERVRYHRQRGPAAGGAC